ncbi:hypothetical protein GINT2_002106 [Glugoides intestinalis]
MKKSIEEYVHELVKKNNLDCYIIFNSDSHINEIIGEKDRNVLRISGFTGSNGTVIISKEPCLITDPRYYLQAEEESKFPLYKGKISDYILEKGYKRVSFNTKIVSSESFKALLKIFSNNSITFIPVEFHFLPECDKTDENEVINLEKMYLKDFLRFPGDVDSLEYNPMIKNYLLSIGLEVEDENLTGSFYQDKIAKIRKLACKKPVVFTELDTIAWILNLRGYDIPCTPVFYSYLIVEDNKTTLFTNKNVSLEGVDVIEYEGFEAYLEKLKDVPTLISGDCNQYVFSTLKNAEITDEIRRMQATKNKTELCGMALAYFFDGIALTELFAFIENNKGFSEEDLANELHNIKSKFKGYVQPSFDTISATGSNAAIVHHRASTKLVDKKNVYLLDCGSHYYFGTTDTTRTMIFGSEVNSQLKHDYTLVLKGHLNAMLRHYPAGSKYSEIDAISRSFLLKEKKDFAHATGHGVGHFLCVHEHPPTIYMKGEDCISSNQVFSIEPGYYKDGEYGIRIENLVISRKEGDGMKLQNITLVPYQNRIVDVSMLTEEEKDYYNNCNLNCIKAFKKFLSFEAYEFLERQCGAL